MILNLHCPPYASGLDDAPGLNGTDPEARGVAPEPVSSKAVRTAMGRPHRPSRCTATSMRPAGTPASANRRHPLHQPRERIGAGALLGALIDLSGKNQTYESG